MDKAKETVKSFMSKDGRHDTSVHEQVAPAVTEENVSRKQHENVMPVVDREVHQDHHHTSVQPIHDTRTLPEQHHHKEVPVEHRTFERGNDDHVRSGLERERAQFQDKQTRVEGERTQQEHAAVTGEHKHHHVHETIQPVVQRQTVEPHVHHTVVPVHEVHQNPTQHHSSSALPPVSMDEFKHKGGALTGREERSDHFQGEPKMGGGGHAMGSDRGLTGRQEHNDGVMGEPRTLGGNLGGGSGVGDRDTRGVGREHDGLNREHGQFGREHDDLARGPGGIGGARDGLDRGNVGREHDGLDRGNVGREHDGLNRGNVGREHDGLNRGNVGREHDGLNRGNVGREHDGLNHGNVGREHDGLNRGNDGLGNSGNASYDKHSGLRSNEQGFQDTNTTSTKKPSLLDKLNPKKDADGDGKAGFMK